MGSHQTPKPRTIGRGGGYRPKPGNRDLAGRNPGRGRGRGGGGTEEDENRYSAWPWLSELVAPRRAKRAAERMTLAAENEGHPWKTNKT